MLKNLRLLRDEKGISQQKLADILRLTQPSINKYENHNCEPDIHTLKCMADYFETSVDFIIGHTSIRRKIEETKEYALSREEQEFIDTFRSLSKEERLCVLTVLKTLKNH
jgi:transcriptional regulator with XRE-family HTH domain